MKQIEFPSQASLSDYLMGLSTRPSNRLLLFTIVSGAIDAQAVIGENNDLLERALVAGVSNFFFKICSKLASPSRFSGSGET